MNQWLIWGIIVVVVFGGVALWRYLSAKKKADTYKKGVEEAQRQCDEAAKKGIAEGMRKSEEIRRKARTQNE